jgi:DNA-binding NtrC family response regulator
MTSRVLVVDDERLIRWGLCQALKDAGYAAEQAGTANEAIEAVGRDMPDLLLLDYKLPDRCGIEVLRAVRKTSPRTPVVMITAHASVGGAVEAMKEGAYDYIGKPFEMEELIQTVNRALETGQLREQIAVFDKAIRAIVKQSPTCRLLMSVPGIGLLSVLAYVSTVEDQKRFARSRSVGAHLGFNAKAISVGRK